MRQFGNGRCSGVFFSCLYISVLFPIVYCKFKTDETTRFRMGLITLATIGLLAGFCFLFGAAVIIRAVRTRAKQVMYPPEAV